jgi:hypothetical protein
MASHIDTFDARGLANSAWAFGKLKYAPNQKLPALIASAAISKLDSFSAQNLSNLLWSFVYLHYRNEELLEAVSKQVRQSVCVWRGAHHQQQQQPQLAFCACVPDTGLIVPSLHCACQWTSRMFVVDSPACHMTQP